MRERAVLARPIILPAHCSGGQLAPIHNHQAKIDIPVRITRRNNVKGSLRTFLSIAALSLLTTPLSAADGILIVETTTRGAGTAQTNQIQIEKTRMRAETATAAGGRQVFTFDGTAQLMRMIDLDKKTYSEITKADIDRLGGQMTAIMTQMQEQMKNLPPAQRAQMEAMMQGRGMPGATAAVKPEFRKAGADKVGKWPCDKYEVYQDNKKTSELCAVDPKTLGFATTDFEVTRQLAAFFQQLMPQNAGQMFAIGQPDQQGFSGIPVRRTYLVGQQQIVTELVEMSRHTFPDATFAVPADFTKQASPFGAGGR
jgi:hypothetical protein